MGFVTQRSRSKDLQDAVERHVWGEQTFKEDGSGSVMLVRGTDTFDEEAPVIVGGYGFQLPSNSNTEVFLISMGSDTNQKMALLSIPRDKQRKWEEGKGGVQHPTNPEMAIEFSDDGVFLKSGRFTLGDSGGVTIEVDGDNITITGNLTVRGNLSVRGDTVHHNGTNIGDDHVHGGVDRGGSNTNGPS